MCFRFEEKFHLEEKGYPPEQVTFAKAALSNMLGGIGYFYGSSLVQSPYNKAPVFYWPAGLYTAVPSRSFFPRGFLWDEGFHNLLIAQWDRAISKEIIAHWLDLLNVEGWIPREMILGLEASQRVPKEFIVQRNTNANPPTLVLSLHYLLQTVQDSDSAEVDELMYFDKLWPRLVAWYYWFNTTQTGDLPGTYRWRGRDGETKRELNPKTLTSGLDDYPRASHPTELERHLDLRCWMALASKLLGDIASFIGRDARKFSATYEYLRDGQLLDTLHWSPASGTYSDFGLHTKDVSLKREPAQPGQPSVKPELVRVTRSEPKPGFVDSSFGYVSLFPLMLELLQPDSSRLGKLLQDLRNESLLWTPFGLRSLAKTSPLYMQRNTEHDPPYWRGPIWINMNFLVVRALRTYARIEGEYKERAAELYDELRRNVIANVFSEYKRTGYVWEQYDDTTGKGKGCRPDARKFSATYEYLRDGQFLDTLHWSPASGTYSDFGLHTKDVSLKREPAQPGQPSVKPELVRVTRSEPKPGFVDSSFGYVSLFPLMLELLQPDSSRLGKLLQDLRNESLLWTPFGLRSLAKTSPLYMQRNTEHDPPYWRGPIWINMNFLVVRALRTYARIEGEYKERAAELYDELRRNVIANVFSEYKRTGYVWEQYDDTTGKGKGCRPFTGWSSLVVLLMSETF
ncbi:unnamed protein product [Notodromas monacha]|uniref:mannosyl-oligosaccharide glucosidase n=1 Tax=Notodromas monacha TaxID=399045 RepID=A0A7R9BW94_9CRUS|nr:unnamed protein product [Notodromas monacha]CAG0921569.1 unnamed protein product [Notodromas monacha]